MTDTAAGQVEVLSGLQHDRIVCLLGACLAPPTICIVEELALGGSLYDSLHTRSGSRGCKPMPQIQVSHRLVNSCVVQLKSAYAGVLVALRSADNCHVGSFLSTAAQGGDRCCRCPSIHASLFTAADTPQVCLYQLCGVFLSHSQTALLPSLSLFRFSGI